VATVDALVGRSDLTDREFEAAVDGLGWPALFELTTLVGYYSTLALQLRVFRVDEPWPSRAAADR
jgi:4-carboxymuconolactone decarboxylase